MLNIASSQKQVFVFMQAVDMRKSFDGLYGLVKTFHSNPLSGDLFLFVSRDRKMAKALYWSGNGLTILMKRLERGSFADVLSRGTMSTSELSLFFDGSQAVNRRLALADANKNYRA